ncbi:hypothetical protein U27_02218 [Candidatus Vecturithrix granuli]|uniref:Lcl C-terminal domain-containing protein n=1 Tax=Vecturithrix granuli TaxID=1499967 RepID=A0A0S6WAX6_VECG1|nr:hypothetical protein U27_02218 [Candidatus Vecturithrix granuli]
MTGFTDNGDGTVTDNLTGLIWLKDAGCLGFVDWATALTKANGLKDGTCGLSDGSATGDWRLLNINELRSLFDPGLSAPHLPAGHPFTDIQFSYYWSSTSYAPALGGAWVVGLNNSHAGFNGKLYAEYAWAVR